MNAKQERFCVEYIADPNASAAARRAGYSERTAYAQGNRLLKDPEVSKRIQAARDEIHTARIASHQRLCEICTEMIEDPSLNPRHRIAAINALAKLKGYAVTGADADRSMRVFFSPEDADL